MKILFTSTQVTSFIREDVEILQRHFHVNRLTTRGFRALITIPLGVLRADVTFTWFASVYSAVVVFFARLFGKPSIVVIGGVDVAKYPEIQYGIWLNPWKAILVKYAMRHAHRLLIVDPFQKGEAMRLAEYDGGNIEYAATGYDANAWIPSAGKEQIVLTVAACTDEGRLKAKGFDFLIRSAKLLPDIKFVVVGISEQIVEKARRDAPSNMEIIPFVERRDLLPLYQKAKVYCQPSYIEGLPNALCEAMLCECVPVGTNVGGIPTAIGDAGFLVPYGDATALSSAIQNALQTPSSMGARARERIAKGFTLRQREEALVRILSKAVQ